MKTSRQDANHCEWLAVQCEGFADHVTRSTETVSPRVMAEDNDRWRANLVLFRRKVTTLRHIDLQCLEEVASDERSDYASWFLCAREINALRDESGETAEDLVLLLPILEIGICHKTTLRL